MLGTKLGETKMISSNLMMMEFDAVWNSRIVCFIMQEINCLNLYQYNVPNTPALTTIMYLMLLLYTLQYLFGFFHQNRNVCGLLVVVCCGYL